MVCPEERKWEQRDPQTSVVSDLTDFVFCPEITEGWSHFRSQEWHRSRGRKNGGTTKNLYGV